MPSSPWKPNPITHSWCHCSQIYTLNIRLLCSMKRPNDSFLEARKRLKYWSHNLDRLPNFSKGDGGKNVSGCDSKRAKTREVCLENHSLQIMSPLCMPLYVLRCQVTRFLFPLPYCSNVYFRSTVLRKKTIRGVEE